MAKEARQRGNRHSLLRNFLLGIASGRAKTVLDAIPNLRLLCKAVDMEGNKVTLATPRLLYTRNGTTFRFLVVPVARAVAIPGQASKGNGGAWDIYELVSESSTPIVGRAALRKLRRAALNAGGAGWLLGPWGHPAIRRAFPAWYAAHLESGGEPTCRRVIAGDDPHRQALVDYDPTDAECLADTDNPPEVE